MTHVTCRLTAKNRDQLRNPTIGNRVWATFTLPKNKVQSNLLKGTALGLDIHYPLRRRIHLSSIHLERFDCNVFTAIWKLFLFLFY